MSRFMDFASEGRVVQITRKMTTECIIVKPEEFQYAKSIMAFSDLDFSCWMMINDEVIEDSDACVCMAEPSTGRFVLYEIRGILIDWERITGCRFQLRQNQRVLNDADFVYKGLKVYPRRCITVDDFLTSRAYVEFRTQHDEYERSVAATVEGQKHVKSVLEAIAPKEPRSSPKSR